MLLLATVAMSPISATASAAADCKFAVNEIDPFTREQMVTTEWVSLKSGLSEALGHAVGTLRNVSAAAIREGERDYLALKLKLSDTTMYRPSDEELQYAVSVPEGAGLWVMTADQVKVQLFADKAVMGKTKAKKDDTLLAIEGGYLVRSTVIIRYALDEAARESLVGQPAIAIRLNLRNKNFNFGYERGRIDFGIHKKSVNDIGDVIDCLG